MMIPTLVLVYDHSSKLRSIENKLIETKSIRVVHLESKVGISLYSNPNSTPFVEGAIVFNDLGQRIATRRDRYDDLLELIEKLHSGLSSDTKKLIKDWYQDQEDFLKERYRKVPDLL